MQTHDVLGAINSAHPVTRLSIATAAVAACLTASVASAATVTINTVNAPETVIPGLTAFATTGANMTGLSVRATFTGGLDETLPWATTGVGAGGVTGAGWSLAVSGDTFTAPWNFTFVNASIGQLSRLILDGSTGLTIFDRTEPSPGTNGSAQGNDFAFSANCAACDAFVTYSGRTALTGDAPLNDLWQTVTISFINPVSGANTGPRTDFSFLQDTDNDVRVNVPEPETYAMMLAGLGLLGFIARRRMRNDNTA